MKRDRKKLCIWLLAAAIVLVVAAVVLALSLKKNGTSEVPQTEAPDAAVVSTEVPAPKETVPVYEVLDLIDGQIQTPYGPLNYPEYLADHLIVVNTGKEPYILEFYAAMEDKQELRLFDLALGEGSGGNMGMVMTSQGELPLNVTIYALTPDDSWTEGEVITAQAMQDVVNEIMDQFAPKAPDGASNAPVVADQPVAADTVNNLEIETPHCTMYYPVRWGNALRYEHEDSQEDVYKVHFYGKPEGREEQLLFSIYLGGDEGDQLGAVMGADGVPVPVYLLMAELDQTGWNEADAELMYSMQEASNQLIEKLPFLP